MLNNTFQKIRLRIDHAGQTVRFNAVCDKGYTHLKAISILLPQKEAAISTTLGLRLNNVKVLDDGHLISEIYCSDSVAPNLRYYVLPELIEANGASIEGRYTDGAKYPLLVDNGDDSGVFDMGKVDFKTLAGYVQNPFNVSFPYDVNISLWLSNTK